MKRHYTSKERIVAAFKREYADRVPITLILGLYQARLAGIPLRQFLTEPAKLAQAVIQAYERLHPDSVMVYGDPYLEAEAAGDELEFPDDAICQVKKHFLEDKANLSKLKMPDPKKDKRLPGFLEACQRVTSTIKDAGTAGMLNGPWNIAVQLRGVQELIYDTADDPKFVHELMRFTTELAKRFGDAQRETRVGINVAEAAASCSLISPRLYREFIKPYHSELVQHFTQRRIGVSMHICGYIDPIMPDVLETGIGALSIDAPSSLEKLVTLSQKKVLTIGNVRTTLFSEGTEAEMEAAVKNCLDIAAKGSGYILCSGCEIPLDSRPENVGYYFAAGNQYGRYD